MMRLDESLFEEVRIDPNFDEIEKALKDVKGTGKVEFDYRPNDGVYKKPEEHFIVLIDEDTEALEEGNKEDFKLYYKNRREWKLGVVNKLKELGWKLEDPMEDNSSYLYLVVEKNNLKREGYELGSPFSNKPGHKVEVYSDYHKAIKRVKELGLKESEYGDVFGTQFSYCCWNKSGDRDEYEDVIAYYKFENGKPIPLSVEDREYIEKEKDLTFDDELKESLTEDINDSEIATLFTQYMDSETPYERVNGAYDVEIYADYRDKIETSELEKIFESNDRQQAFYELLWEAYQQAEWDYAADIRDGFMEWLQKTRTDVNNVDKVEEWLNDYLYDYVDIHPDYDHFKGQEINTILMLDTGDANYDFVLNPSYANDYGKGELDDKASIVWLAKQQGHNKEDVQKAIEDESSSNRFLKSVMEECYNTTSSMNSVVFLGKCELGDLLTYNVGKDTIKVKKDAMCGLVDTWSGGGSILGIELEKDVIVPADCIYYFGPDEAVDGYGVDSIYGLTGQAWLDNAFIISPTKQESIGQSDDDKQLTEKLWKKKVPQDLARAFHKAIEKDSDDLLEVKDAILAICDWLESIDEDLEWEVQDIRDAWDIVDIDDRYGYFDPEYDEDDYDDEESDFVDDRTNEDFVNEEIISVLYDILDANDIWMPVAHELGESVSTHSQHNLKKSFNSVCKQLAHLKEHKFNDARFTKDLVESVNEIENAVIELSTKYFEE